ncbi:cysteinyl-tRNA synthetase [uncultured Alphaproteobacteria bacterium]|uniref:Cysteine--tRNA ligase n=1 Tax=uncultured Alphaproteobacteria bacterium TaxID=91750 RepID=A0A212IWJ5_9PROT|nr:cysteinyl-tRNA synthetase [uncultured Alphaproteobacteria bacterium]
MGLTVYNTLTRSRDAFAPIDPNHVRMYVCGPTVYDRAHIGNARPVVVFDTLYRLLKRSYSRVTYVRNITDVDDKINARAKESGRAIRDITEETAAWYHEDMAALNALPPDVEPRATEHIAEMIALIAALIDKGHAYAAEGHVLFAVGSMPDYGALSRRSRDEMIAGARVEVAPYKRDPGDFVLWKPSTPDLPGWDSPWGRGRPGWHIECSAMSGKYLGTSFDIHGGGQDLVFPHHENEIAQSTCAHGAGTFARYWMHNGYLMVDGEKMSKSLGNFFTVKDLLAKAPGEAIRLTLLSTHYHQPLNWTDDALAQAKQALDRFYTALERVEGVAAAGGEAELAPVLAALEDDLNTPAAIAAMHDLATRLNKADAPAEQAALKAALLAAGELVGLLRQSPAAWRRGGAAAGPSDAEIDAMVAARAAARAARDFAEADRLRRALADAGVTLEDGAGATRWRRG